MKIKLDRENRRLNIDDNLKMTYWMLKFVMLTNGFQMFIRIYKASISQWDLHTWLWLPIGLVSLFTLFYFSKLSTKEVIALDEIERPIHKKFFGRKRLSLKLKNGKTRHLPTKSLREIQEIQDFLNLQQRLRATN